VYHDQTGKRNKLKTAITVYIKNISQAVLQKVFANKIKWVHTSNTFCKCTATFRTHCILDIMKSIFQEKTQ